MKRGILQAIARIGSQKELADRIHVTPQAVSRWVSRGEVPPRRCPDVSLVSGVPVDHLNKIFIKAYEDEES
jgi:DNA-binding transcriptional regulator YdaS (Cro superfamily)